MPAPRHAAFGATGKSFRRSSADAGLLQEAWLRLGSHSRDDLLELADEVGLAVVFAHLVHELVPAVREPGHGEALLRSAEAFHRSGVLLALVPVHYVQTERAPQPGGLFRVRLIEGFRRLNGAVARMTQVVVVHLAMTQARRAISSPPYRPGAGAAPIARRPLPGRGRSSGRLSPRAFSRVDCR